MRLSSLQADLKNPAQWEISHIACLMVLFILVSPLFGFDDGPEMTLTDATGHRLQGVLTGLSENQIVFKSKKQTTWNLSDLLKIEFQHRKPQAFPKSAVLFLANGDRLGVNLIGMKDDFFEATWDDFSDLPSVSIPLESVHGAILQMPEIPSNRSVQVQRLLARREENDLLILKNKDQVFGEITGINPQKFLIELGTGETGIERTGVTAIVLNSELTVTPELNQPGAMITLTDGSKITGHSFRLVGNRSLQFQTVWGTELELPITAVNSLQFIGGRFVYLSDLEPDAYEDEPFLSARRAFKNDRNVTGGPLTLRGVEYAKGLGLYSRCEFSYSLDRQYETFAATVGIDDSTNGKGSVTVTFLADGKQIFSTEEITGKSDPLKVSLPLKGKKEFTIIVEFGQWGDVLDRVNLCDARFVKTRLSP